jgi:hypothetical protein
MAQSLVNIHAQKIVLETEMLKVWKDPKTGRRIEAFICPVAPHPVPPIDRWNGVSYTSSFVLLDYPAGTLPVRDFKEEDLKSELGDSKLLGRWDKINRELCRYSLSDRPRGLLTMDRGQENSRQESIPQHKIISPSRGPKIAGEEIISSYGAY